MARQTEKPAKRSSTVRGQLESARSALARARVPAGWLDAEVLLAHVLKRPREWLHTYPERRVASRQRQAFQRLVRRRAARVPVAYLTGEREFFGHRLRVTPAVLIPRPETERLVELAIDWLGKHPGARQVIDLGTGSGAIAIAVAAAVPSARVRALDVSQRALRVATSNIRAQRLASRVKPERRDLLAGARKADLILGNLPYVSTPQQRSWPRDLEFEPLRALDGGRDGLDLIRAAITQAPAVIRPGGALLFECEPGQTRRIASIAGRTWPSATISVHQDLAGRNRVVQIELQ